MTVSASIQFTQGVTVGAAGEALIGVADGTQVVCSNASNLNVESFTWEIVDVPPSSAVPTGVQSSGPLSQLTFVPDLPGGYLVHLTVVDLAGNKSDDYRVFQVAEASGHIIPPFSALGRAMNFSGQARGWAKYLESLLRYLLGTHETKTTTDATVTTLVSGTLANNKTTIVRAKVVAHKSDSSAGAAYVLTAAFRNNGGTVAQIGTTSSSPGPYEDAGAWDATIDTTGTTWRIRVTGAAATTIKWYTRVETLEVGT